MILIPFLQQLNKCKIMTKILCFMFLHQCANKNKKNKNDETIFRSLMFHFGVKAQIVNSIHNNDFFESQNKMRNTLIFL